jgi:hypothetical protein
VSETKEVACKLCGREGHWKNLKGQPVFFHTQGHCKSDLPRLARCSYRGSWDSFTHPTKCRDCGGRCYFYQNQNGSKVFFDSLGPPWPKHFCHERKQQPPDWKAEGFTPIHILDAIPDTKHQALSLQIEILPSGIKVALRLKERKDIPRLRAVMAHPFHVRQPAKAGDCWILSTFEEAAGGVWPKTFKCEQAPFQGQLDFS